MSFEKCYYRRCCFCLPLRGGLLALGYIHVIFSTLMVGLISYSVHTDSRDTFVIEGVISGIDREVCIAGYCIEFIFTVLLLYGVHRRMENFLRMFTYYTICTLVAASALEIYVIFLSSKNLGLLPLFYMGMLLQIYLAFQVRNLLKKLKMVRPAGENGLQIVNVQIV